MKTRIKLSDHFSCQRLLKFVFPSIAMTIFISVYGVIDGVFVSNFAGKDAFTAVNLIWPLPQLVAAFGFMIGTGGSALVAQMLGEKRSEEAQQSFTLLIAVASTFALTVGILGFIFIRQLAILVGAQGVVLDNCIIYGRILFLCVPFYVLQYVFQSFLIVAEKPKLGLYVTILAGILNFIGDAVFIAVMKLGITGAAIATAVSQLTGGILPIIYFSRQNDSLLRFTRFKWDFRFIKRTCANGVSELFSNISLSLVTIIYNMVLMSYFGENGVDAYGAISYLNYVFVASFLGYASGSSPIVAYHYGANNTYEINNILKKSMVIISAGALIMFMVSGLFARQLAAIFTSYDAGLWDLTTHAMKIHSIYYLFCGFSIYMSSFFTALGNGPVSAVISFLRTFVFEVGCVFILPGIFGTDGVWFSPVTAQVLALALSFTLLFVKNKQYRYLRVKEG